MKVCFLIYNLEPGGLQNYLFRFLTHYRHQFTATVIVKNGESGHFFKSFVSIDIDVQLIKCGYFNIKGWIKISRFLRKKKFDSVCDLTGNFSGVYLLIAKCANIERRIAYYGQSQDHFKKTPLNKIYNFIVRGLVFRYATYIITNSQSGMDYFFSSQRLTDARFKIIPNGINPDDFSCNKDTSIRLTLSIPNNAFVIGNTSRFDDKKNHNAILQLAKLSFEKNDNFYYLICGYGTEGLLNRIKDMNLEARVFVLGYRRDVPLVLRNLDAFFFPSFTEGISNSLIEALLSGLPIVASNIDAIKETLPLGLWGNLIEPDDYAGAYQRLLSIKNGFYRMKSFELRDWAINSFQHEIHFRSFFECLQ